MRKGRNHRGKRQLQHSKHRRGEAPKPSVDLISTYRRNCSYAQTRAARLRFATIASVGLPVARTATARCATSASPTCREIVATMMTWRFHRIRRVVVRPLERAVASRRSGSRRTQVRVRSLAGRPSMKWHSLTTPSS